MFLESGYYKMARDVGAQLHHVNLKGDGKNRSKIKGIVKAPKNRWIAIDGQQVGYVGLSPLPRMQSWQMKV